MGNKDNLKDFVIAFFKNMKCNVSSDSNTLIVKDVPKAFEDFCGKKSPYYFVFNKEDLTENSELLTKGSFFLSSMTNFLENKGQTTLLKINFDFQSENELKKYFSLNNCDIANLEKKATFDYFLRFTFQTNFQYLNEREQIITPVFVHRCKVVELNLNRYAVCEGKKEDISPKDIDSDYLLAKERLKISLDSKTKSVSEALNVKLQKEMSRIKDHFIQQEKERTDQITRHKSHLKDLEAQYSVSQDKKIEDKITKTKEVLSTLEDPKIKEKESTEEKFFTNDEIHKHSLSINNKLINTTIIYYPIYLFKFYLKNPDAARLVEINYNPLIKEIDPISCEICREKTNELILCSAGHISCKKCSGVCTECRKILCKNCLNAECTQCFRKLCKKCLVKCPKCSKLCCKRHFVKDSISGKEFCPNCLISCPSCRQFADKSKFRLSSGRSICEICARKEIGKKAVSNAFRL